MTNEDKKQPGDRRIDTDTWNTIIDMVKDWKRNKFHQEQGGFFASLNPRLTILAGNITPTTYSTSFKVLKLTNTPITVTNGNKLQVNMRPAMQVDIPDSATNAICITQSPASSEDEDPDQFAYVLAAVLGITLAYVRINDESNLFAVPIAGNVDFLDSAYSGQVRIIEVLDEMQEESGVSGFMPVSGLDESGSGPFDSVKLCIVNIIGGGSGTGPGTATGGCGLSALKPTDCVKFTNSFDSSIHYGTNTGTGVWTSDTSLMYPGGSGVAVLTKITGGWTLTVDGIAMDTCGTGCWMGGPATGHASSSGGGKCDGVTFTVCVECSCCEVEGWDGEGWYCVEDENEECIVAELLEVDRYDCDLVICSGPYATEEEALAACGPVTLDCSCDPEEILELPQNLYVHFTDLDGAKTAQVAYNAGLSSPGVLVYQSNCDVNFNAAGGPYLFSGIRITLTCAGGGVDTLGIQMIVVTRTTAGDCYSSSITTCSLVSGAIDSGILKCEPVIHPISIPISDAQIGSCGMTSVTIDETP